MTQATIMPKRREADLTVVDLEGETLVYDLKVHKAYCLNASAALVWRHCDGQSTVTEAAQALVASLGGVADEDVVGFALGELAERRLLEGAEAIEVRGGLTRRELTRRAAVAGAAVLVPAIASIVAPSAASAASVGCQSQSDCPPGYVCVGQGVHKTCRPKNS